MANNINLAKVYTPLVDELYRTSSVTTVLDSGDQYIKAGANTSEVVYPQVSTDGLGDYDRASGYTDASVAVEWKTAKFNYDRGAKIMVDAMDDQETYNLSLSMGIKSLIKDKATPEMDAFTFATLAGKPGVSVANVAGESYADSAAFLNALIKANTKMDEDEVPGEDRHLFATPALLNGIMALDTTKSREVLATFATVNKVPQNRFYTAIDLKDGKTPGEESGHYTKAADGKDINFIVVHKPAVIKGNKHVVQDIIPAASNPNADADIMKYRDYAIVDVVANKVAGIYVSYKA